MKATYCEHVLVESALFKDLASTSHGLFGNYTGSIYTEACLLRGMETVELY